MESKVVFKFDIPRSWLNINYIHFETVFWRRFLSFWSLLSSWQFNYKRRIAFSTAGVVSLSQLWKTHCLKDSVLKSTMTLSTTTIAVDRNETWNAKLNSQHTPDCLISSNTHCNNGMNKTCSSPRFLIHCTLETCFAQTHNSNTDIQPDDLEISIYKECFCYVVRAHRTSLFMLVYNWSLLEGTLT